MSFDQLGLSAELLCSVTRQGYQQPTPIQKRAIPLILSGQDILASCLWRIAIQAAAGS
jgi:ATP-dependent RNA helicase RhlE